MGHRDGPVPASWRGAAASLWDRQGRHVLKVASVPAVLALALYLLGMLGRGQP